MKVTTGDLRQVHDPKTKVVVTLGNFDGLHRGHQYLIKQLCQQAGKHASQAMVITFFPHPQEYFSQIARAPLMARQARRRRFQELGVEWLHEQDFNESFSLLDPEDFLRHYLKSHLNLQGLLLGYDYRFGRQSRGDYNLAVEVLGPDWVEQATALVWGEEVVSSTSIREALQVGDVRRANNLLGRPYQLSGQVVKGQALGRQLGFPTANLSQIEEFLPAPGVYAGQVSLVSQEKHPALMNVGFRPTVADALELRCECHILDYSHFIYDQKLAFQFKERIRPEMKFENIEALKGQIQKDVQTLRSLIQDGL